MQLGKMKSLFEHLRHVSPTVPVLTSPTFPSTCRGSCTAALILFTWLAERTLPAATGTLIAIDDGAVKLVSPVPAGAARGMIALGEPDLSSMMAHNFLPFSTDFQYIACPAPAHRRACFLQPALVERDADIESRDSYHARC